MKINQNNDISVYRGETGAIDFKISQRSDYYVPFLISSARVNPMVCITIGSTRRESKNIVTKQLWLEVDSMLIPKFTQTVVTDLGTISSASESTITTDIEPGTMYQFKRETEVNTGNPQLHFVYSIIEDNVEVAHIDDYDFTVIMAIDETITLDMTNNEYYYQIELMDTELMLDHLLEIFEDNPALINKLPDDFAVAYAVPTTGPTDAITTYLSECISVVTKAFPNHWGYRINNPLTSPVASVSAIQMLQPPRKFTVISVIK